MRRIALLLLALLCAASPAGASSTLPGLLTGMPQFFSNQGAPLSGGKVYTCQPGTTCGPGTLTPKTTYTDITQVTPNANPVILDSAGRAAIWLNGYYKIALYDASGVLVKTLDNVSVAGVVSGVTTPIFFDASGGPVSQDIKGFTEYIAYKTDSSANAVTLIDTSGNTFPGGLTSYVLPTAASFVHLVLQGGVWYLESVPPASVAAVIGTSAGLKMSVTATSASATLAADEIQTSTALGGVPYKLASFSKTINLATTGAGGMDTGGAPVTGYVSIYAIYNPTTQTAALLACNVTTSTAAIYAGANMPAGYIASALVSIWATNVSSQFKIGFQAERTIYIPIITILNNGVQTTLTSFSLTAAVPPGAKSWGGSLSISGTATLSTLSVLTISGDVLSTGQQSVSIPGSAAGLGHNVPIQNIPIVAAQTAYYLTINPAGNTIGVSSYKI